VPLYGLSKRDFGEVSKKVVSSKMEVTSLHNCERKSLTCQAGLETNKAKKSLMRENTSIHKFILLEVKQTIA